MSLAVDFAANEAAIRVPANDAGNGVRGSSMVGPRKGTRERAFAKRLDQALDRHPRCPTGYGRNTWLLRELQHQQVKVSNETIRKWLAGETMPRRPKMTAIAKALRVDETWLAMGAQSVEGLDESRIEVLTNALAEIKERTTDPAILEIIEKAWDA